MKIKVNGMEIIILAKMEGEQHYSEAETRSFLNSLACILAEASRSYKAQGFNALSEEALEMHLDIFNQLDQLGYYDRY